MPPARRRRSTEAILVSVAVHAVVLVALALHAPRLRIPRESAGPPPAVIPVLIVPHVPPPAPGTDATPAPIRLHRRPQRFAPEELPVAPLIAPEAEAPRAPPSPARPTITGPPAEDPVAASGRQALRGLVGCANPHLLSRAERERCEERLAAGAKEAPQLGLGINREKARDFARTAERKAADARYRSAPPTPPDARGAWSSAPSATEMSRQLGNERPAATKPF